MHQDVPPAVRRRAESKNLGKPLVTYHPTRRHVGKNMVICLVCWAGVGSAITSWSSGDVFLWNGGAVSPVLVLVLMLLIAVAATIRLVVTAWERQSAASAYVYEHGLVVHGVDGQVLSARWEALSGLEVVEERVPNSTGVGKVARRSYALHGHDGKKWHIGYEFGSGANFVDLVNAVLADLPEES